MKKWLAKIACVFMVAVLCGCGSEESGEPRTIKSTTGVEDLLKAEKEKSEAKTEKAEAKAESDEGMTNEADETRVQTSDSDISMTDDTNTDTELDLDLTTLSSTLVYSEVYNMMVNSEEYCGKRIKMSGIMAYYHDEQTGNDYFSCIIQDATACCAQGIEFELTKDYVYPQDYPEVGTVITVVGIFDTYWEGEYEYCTLRNAKLL